jgi:hypothetical protein
VRDLAPGIVRQRLLIEATYRRDVTESDVREYLLGLAGELDLRTYGEPIVHSPGGEGKDENQGFDAFVPLIDSGIALYVWTVERFLSCVLYTCKRFDADRAVAFTREFFEADDLDSQPF